jgi:hypothetical protein
VEHAFNYSKKRWDKSHKAINFEPGSLVVISTLFFDFGGTADKLKQAYVGPFTVEKMIGPNAVKVKLTDPYTKRHSVFPISLVQPYAQSSPEEFPTRRAHEPKEPPVIQEDGEEYFEIDFIRKEKKTKDGMQYMVHWKGYGPEFDEWVDEDKIQADDVWQEYADRKARKAPKTRAPNSKPPAVLQEPIVPIRKSNRVRPT